MYFRLNKHSPDNNCLILWSHHHENVQFFWPFQHSRAFPELGQNGCLLLVSTNYTWNISNLRQQQEVPSFMQLKSSIKIAHNKNIIFLNTSWEISVLFLFAKNTNLCLKSQRRDLNRIQLGNNWYGIPQVSNANKIVEFWKRFRSLLKIRLIFPEIVLCNMKLISAQLLLEHLLISPPIHLA